MCFSATASFIASGTLAASGAAIAFTPKPRKAIPLSLFPIFFAILQFAEGLLWLNHRGFLADSFKPLGVYIFLAIAYVLWPIYVPFSAYVLETGKKRKAIILVCQVLGLVVGITNLIAIVSGPVGSSVAGHSIAYTINMPDILSAPYVISVGVPFLVSGNRRLVIFGAALAVLYVIAAVVASSATFPSVWCFYAAILSGFLFFIFRFKAEQTWKTALSDVSG